MQKVKILEAVKIINDTVKKFDGIRSFLSTGDLDVTVIKSLEEVTYFDKPSRANQNVKKDDIILARMQGTVKVKIIDSDEDNIIVSTGFMVLRCNEGVNNRYIFHYLKSSLFQSKKDKLCSGATQKAINNNKFAEIRIPLPDLPAQQKIAEILDKADQLCQYNKQLIKKYDALTQSLFLEMFGDPMKNEKDWIIKELHEIATISSGITKGRKNKSEDSIGELPYMRVANVQDDYLDLTEIKTIPAFKTDLEKFLLKKGDVLMTEGGDPDKLGRGAVWQNEIEQCLHQNHIFKVRVDSNLLTPLYFNKLAGSAYGKKYFLKIAKQTTGIATINKTQLSKFPVLVASLNLQNQFAERVQMIEIQKQQAQEALAKSEELFQSLLHRAFKGELN